MSHRSLLSLLGVVVGTTVGACDAPDPLSFRLAPTEVPAGEERERCAVFALPAALTIDEIRASASLNTHHLAATLTPVALPLGESPCAAVFTEEVMRRSYAVFSSTSASQTVRFPPGTAAMAPPGYERLILSLHHLNASRAPTTAEAHLSLHQAAPGTPRLFSGLVAAQRGFVLLPHSFQLQTGRCDTAVPLDVIALSGHAHRRASSLVVRLLQGGVRQDLPHYESRDFDEPSVQLELAAPLHLEPGDGIEWTCAYHNDGDLQVREGPLAADEMCVALLGHNAAAGALGCETTPQVPVGVLRPLAVEDPRDN